MAKRKSGLDIDGILLLDKGLGISSNRALQEVRKLFNANKAGHTGSLDPLATGLLPLCFGHATKVSGLLLDQDKRYLATVRLGVVTDSGDAEGQILEQNAVPALTLHNIETCLAAFRGTIDQVPPMYSALKVQGKKLYELAREGKTIERLPRQVEIFSLNLVEFNDEYIHLDVHCSKGTYIRTLAEDIGRVLGCGASLSALRRTQVGVFNLQQAFTIEQLRALAPEALQNCLLCSDTALNDYPKVQLSEQQARSIQFGQVISMAAEKAGTARLYLEDKFLGLGEQSIDGKLAPRKLFC